MTGTVQGDGNGIIEWINANGTNAANTKAAEGLVAWQHLLNSKMIDQTFTMLAATPTIATMNVIITPNTTISSVIPSSKVKSAGWVFDRIANAETVTPTTTESFLILTGPIPATTAAADNVATLIPIAPSSTANALTAIDALAIDTKTDDGYPRTGRVRAVAATGVITASLLATHCYDSSTNIVGTLSKGSYYTASTGTTCALGFQVSQN